MSGSYISFDYQPFFHTDSNSIFAPYSSDEFLVPPWTDLNALRDHVDNAAPPTKTWNSSRRGTQYNTPEDHTLFQIMEEEKALERASKRLATRRFFIYKQKARIHNATLPIFRLPSELLGYILDLSHSPPARYSADFRQLRKKHPIIMASICQRLRAVAMSQSSLWADLQVDRGTSYEYVDLFLTRSGNWPLAIHIDFLCNSEGSWTARTYRIWIHIEDQAHRLRQLSVEQKAGNQNDVLLDGFVHRLSRVHLPLLQRLVLKMRQDFHDEEGLPNGGPDGQRLLQFPNAPRLSQLTLCEITFHLRIPVSPSITTLVFTWCNIEMNHIQAVISNLPNLVNLVVSQGATSDWMGYIHIPTLTTLRIDTSEDADDSTVEFINSLSLPCLSTLILSSPGDYEIIAWLSCPPRYPLATKHTQFPLLKTLVLDRAWIEDPSVLLDLSMRLPTIEHLFIWQSGDTLKNIIEGLQDPKVFPVLRTLTLLDTQDANLPILKIGTMLDLRTTKKNHGKEGQGRIQRLYMYNRPPLYGKWLFSEFTEVEYLSKNHVWPEWYSLLGKQVLQ